MKARTFLLVGAIGLVITSVVFAAVLISRNSPTSSYAKQRIIERYAPGFAEKRKQFQTFRSLLPPQGTLSETIKAAPVPVPVFDSRGSDGNTEIVHVDQLSNPDVIPFVEKQFDLGLHANLLLAMRWTGPSMPTIGPRPDHEPSGDALAAKLENALAYTYLVVVRPVKYIEPKILFNSAGTNSFFPGMVELELFVFDLRSSKLIAATRLAGQTNEEVQVVSGAASDMQSGLRSAAWSDLRRQVGRSLADITGGTFKIN